MINRMILNMLLRLHSLLRITKCIILKSSVLCFTERFLYRKVKNRGLCDSYFNSTGQHYWMNTIYCTESYQQYAPCRRICLSAEVHFWAIMVLLGLLLPTFWY